MVDDNRFEDFSSVGWGSIYNPWIVDPLETPFDKTYKTIKTHLDHSTFKLVNV
jgi:hypothetical protein